jgi:hypothetical protein
MSMNDWEIGAAVRGDVLVRLVEQAMTDPDFRARADEDLATALKLYGFDLNDDEWILVSRFRQTLENADIDLSLGQEIPPEYLTELFGR